MSTHGGARPGSGRPRKWSFTHVLAIGQACEEKWRDASTEAFEARLAALPYAGKIQALWDRAQAIPVPQRKAWPKREDHSGDLESWLHAAAGTPFDYDKGKFGGDVPRRVALSAKPPKGTRTRIIDEVATQNNLSTTTVDNLWQAYRRFESKLRESAKT